MRALEGKRLLIVDDGQDGADSLGELCRLRGAEVRIAYTGLQALAVLDRWAPDVALIDLAMPGIDGYQLAREIRRRPELDRVQLVAFSGWILGVDPEIATQAGFARLVLKPADLPGLEALLVELCRGGSPDPPAGPEPRSGPAIPRG